MRAKRFFVYCYDVSPDFVEKFKYPKKDGKDEFLVNYMEAAFDQEAKRGEFFVEFADSVYDNNLVDRFEAQGAKGACAVTFQHNDGDKSAINALACVLTLQDKTGSKASRGTSGLLADARAKQVEDAKQEELLSKETTEKLAAVYKLSVDAQNVKLDGIGSSMQSCEAEIVEVRNEVHSHAVVMDDIKHGVCNVIPDYQNENKSLKEALKHQRWLCDVQESKTAAQTTKVNRLNAEVSSFHVREDTSLKREEAYLKREEAYLKRIKELEDNLEVRKTIENARQVAQLAHEDRAFLKEELAFARSERAACRQSAMERDETVLLEENEEERAAKRPRV